MEIEGAKPGDMLSVEVLDMQPEGLGFTYPQEMEDRVVKYLSKVKNGELP